MSGARFRLTGALLLVAVALGIGERIVLTRGTRPALLWDSPSYVEYAREMASRETLPPAGWRTPGYPAFLLATGRPFFRAEGTVRWQQALGVAEDAMTFLLVLILTDSPVAAFVAGLGSLALFDLRLMELTIYTETLAGFCLLGATLGAAACVRASGRRAAIAILAASVFAGFAPLVRPNLVTVSLVVGVILIADLRRLRIRRAVAAAGLFLVVAPVGAVSALHFFRDGYPGISTATGITLLDAVGYPRFYRALPPSLSDVREVYERAGAGREMVFYWDVIDALRSAEAARGRVYRDRDRACAAIALRCIRAAPGAYAAVWWDTARRYASDYQTMYGLYADVPSWAAHRRQIGGRRLDAIWVDRRWGNRLALPVTLLALAGVPLLLIAFRSRRPADTVRSAVVVCWSVAATTALLCITLESAPGGDRYRAPIEPLILALTLWAIVEIARRVRTRPAAAGPAG